MSPKKVLFVCIGNACRSQMAEGFARAYGKDVMIPASAGLSPATAIPPLTVEVMAEKNIQLAEAFPKDISFLMRTPFEIVVNLSGASSLPISAPRIIEWAVPDPIGKPAKVYRQTRDDIENRVMQLILALRGGKI